MSVFVDWRCSIVLLFCSILCRDRMVMCQPATCESYTEDFESGTLGFFDSSCDGASNFLVKTYLENDDMIDHPDSSEYYITIDDKNSCNTNSVPAVLNSGSKIEISYILRDPFIRCVVFIMNFDDSDDQIATYNIVKNDNDDWQSNVYHMLKDASVKIQIRCFTIGDITNIFAINSISTECAIPTTTDTTTTETTTFGTTPGTTPTSTTTAPIITTGKPPSESEPWSAIQYAAVALSVIIILFVIGGALYCLFNRKPKEQEFNNITKSQNYNIDEINCTIPRLKLPNTNSANSVRSFHSTRKYDYY